MHSDSGEDVEEAFRFDAQHIRKIHNIHTAVKLSENTRTLTLLHGCPM